MPRRVVSEKELTACYGLMFAEYPDIVNIRQLQTMLGISRHAAYDLLGEGEIYSGREKLTFKCRAFETKFSRKR